MLADGEGTGGPLRVRLRTVAYVLVVLAVWGITQYRGLGERPLSGDGEPRAALVVWETAHRGGWILPRRNGTEIPDSPPLYHWLATVTAALRGELDEWSLRFPSAALSLLAVLAVFAAAARLWTPRAALLSAVILLTAPGWGCAAVRADTDMAHAAHFAAASLSLLFFVHTRRPLWLVPTYTATALAVLAQGPTPAVLVAAIALCTALVVGRAGFLRAMRPLAGFLFVAGLAAAWYVPALLLGGEEVLHRQTWYDRLTSLSPGQLSVFDYGRALLGVLTALFVGLLPWSLFLPAVVTQRRRNVGEPVHGATRRLLLAWVLVVSVAALGTAGGASAGGASVDLLPAFPAIALLLGSWWDGRMREGPPGPWPRRTVKVVSLVLLVSVAAAGVLGLAMLPARWSGLAPASLAPALAVVQGVLAADLGLLAGSAVVVLAALCGCLHSCRIASWRLLFACLGIGSIVAVGVVQRSLLAELARQRTQREFTAAVRRVVGPDTAVFFHRRFDDGVVFYAGRHMPVYDGELNERAPRYLLVEEREWNGLQRVRAVPFERVPLRSGPSAPRAPRFALVRRVDP